MTNSRGKMPDGKIDARQLASRLARSAAYLSSDICHLSSLVWRLAREVSGEAAYERRLRQAPGSRADAKAIFLRTLEEKYSRPCRCC